ncbi:MAG: adenylosuccinate lyase [Candidatus Omnitrophica bacterium]|nr:adenylosuccinate lyase [Candidatus Omnitrophota bacterium]
MIQRYSLPEMSKVWEDESKFSKMLQIEILTCEALSKLKKIPAAAVSNIKRKAKFNIKQIQRLEEKTHHDIVAFVNNVSRYIGRDAQYFHMGITSSDLLDTALALQMREAADILIDGLSVLLRELKKKAKKYKDTPCMGRSHGVHAEPTTFGLKMALAYDEMRRNLERLQWAKYEISVGKISGAVGTYSNIDPRVEQYVCRKLNIRPAAISTQVIQRDIHAVFVNVLALIGASLEKMALEFRHLQRTEVLEVEEPFASGQKGSSAMPHKRNPVICERICGLARLLRANAHAAFEDVALWHERDISHSSVERVILPDSTLALDYMLNKMIYVVSGLNVYPENMMANIVRSKGLFFSQKILVALMNKGLNRPRAYDIVQRAAMQCWKRRVSFKEVLLEDKAVMKHMSYKELDDCFKLDAYLKNVGMIFNRLGL